MSVKILKADKHPLTIMGEIAGICYGQDNPNRWASIAKRCLAEGHGRVSEFTDITIEFKGCSAKVAREWYTHIAGTSRLQASTRYIDYSKQFKYVTPPSIANTEGAELIWHSTMAIINKAMTELRELNVPTEDFTNLLPLAYQTTFVCKINLRSLINMFHVRACTCAYHEYRKIMTEIKKQLSEISDEYEYIAKEYFVPKCEVYGFCDEKKRSCGRKKIKEN